MENNITPDMRNELYLAKLETPVEKDPSEQLTASDDAVSHVAQELGKVLISYVDLLDNDNHGGWSKQDEEKVRSAVTMLNRAGRGIHRRSVLKSRISSESPEQSTESGEPLIARRLRGIRTTRKARESSEQTRWDTDGGANWDMDPDS